jgi:hypothetical protein
MYLKEYYKYRPYIEWHIHTYELMECHMNHKLPFSDKEIFIAYVDIFEIFLPSQLLH